MMKIQVLALCALTVAAYDPEPSPPPMDCKYDTGKGASYDLTKLQELTQTKPFVVRDRYQVAQKDYVYTFGVYHTVEPPKMCLNADGSSRVDPYWAPAWQTNGTQTEYNTPKIDDRHCMYLGGNGEGVLSNVAEWSVLDEEDPGTLGVRLTYTHGQHCSSHGERRKLKLNFKCMRVGIEKIEKNVMDESSHCTYEINIESEYACPTQCGFGGGHAICNNHGVCGYDTDNNVAKCFCNEGYSGPGCDESPEQQSIKGYGAILALLIIITIAVVALGAALVGLWRFMSVRTVPMDGQSYARLENDGSFTPMRMDVKGPDGL